MEKSVTVITITRHRMKLLPRAIESVRSQTYLPNGLQHMILIDDCVETRNAISSQSLLPNTQIYFLPRFAGDKSGPARLAYLRNYSVKTANSRWISFLDDDNEFAPDHIETLVECASITKSRAVHSYMQLLTGDGKPYLENRLPWAKNREEGRREYERLTRKGVFIMGSNISHDRIDPIETIDPVRTVDTGEWLFERALLLEYPFPTEYSDSDWETMTTEDDKLIDVLVRNRINISCTKKATLKYYLGGYSNTFQFD